MKRIFIFLMLAFVLLASHSVYGKEPLVIADNFIKEKGEFSFIGDYLRYETDHFWNKQGKKRRAYNHLSHQEVDIFLEYGLTQNDTVGVYTYLIQNDEKLNKRNKRGVEDLEICWKHFLITKCLFDFSFRVIGIIPVEEQKIGITYGRYGVEFDLHCQREFTFQNRCGWYELMAGYRYYNGFPSDVLKVNGVIGYQLFPRLRVMGAAYLDYGLFNGREKFVGPVLTLAPQYRLLEIKLYAVFTLTRFCDLFAGGFQHVWGENVGTGGGYFTGISLDF